MPRKKLPSDTIRRTKAAALQVSLDALAERATGAADPALAYARLNEVTNSLWWDGSGEAVKVLRTMNVMHILTELAPRDEYERMLVHQMMAAHNATMECFRRSMIPSQPPEGRDLNLKHAQKLSSLYAMQLETLNKHRGKGQQKVTVEHVHVAAGGQAIVGNIEQPDARTTSTKRRKVAPPQIEHQSAVPSPFDQAEDLPAPAVMPTKVAHD